MTGVYLAYPIDQSSSMVRMLNQIEQFKQVLVASKAAEWVFDPGDALTTQPPAQMKEDPAIRQINQFAARKADVIAAFLPQGMATVGVPMEIERGVQAGKTVLVFSDVGSYMLAYVPGVIDRYPGWEDDSLDAAVALILGLPKAPNTNIEALPVQMLSDMGFMPKRSHADDAGLDLFVSQDTNLMPGSFTDVPCAIAVELPPWSWAMVTGRSSTLRKRALLVHPGVIDSGYRGPIFAGTWNLGDDPVTVARGERIAQLIVFANHTQHIAPMQVEKLSESTRGVNGFGSSGA